MKPIRPSGSPIRLAGASCAGLTALVLCFGADARAEAGLPDYRDDRSTAEAVIQSLYNAVARKEYLRAWSYFSDTGERPDYDAFRDGYATTESATVRTGTVTNEGAAGSIFYSVPVVVEAGRSGGRVSVFVGCYELRQVQPAMQEVPPFRPIGIVRGRLKESGKSFDDSEGECPEKGLE